jgi:hypothetical protein
MRLGVYSIEVISYPVLLNLTQSQSDFEQVHLLRRHGLCEQAENVRLQRTA